MESQFFANKLQRVTRHVGIIEEELEQLTH
jgi:hypothetical protein